MTERIIKSVSVSGSKQEWLDALAASRTPHASQSDEYGRIHTDGSRSGGHPVGTNTSQSEALVEEIGRALWASEGLSITETARAILPIITAREASACAEGRREGIEAAAKVADDLWDRVAGNSERKLHHRMAYRQVAASIRALTEKQP